MQATDLEGRSELIERIQAILDSRELTLSQVSARSEEFYGRGSHFFVPHNFYYELRLGNFSPSLQQLCALSRITDFQLKDWLLVFGFDLDAIPILQATFPSKRTFILDTEVNNESSWMPWFHSRPGKRFESRVMPLKELVEFAGYRRIGSGKDQSLTRCYLKIGYQDAIAFPELLPGSIVSVRRGSVAVGAEREAANISQSLFLVEYRRGFVCCRIHRIAEDRIVLVSDQLPYAQIELRVPGEAILLGVLEQEFRFLASVDQPEVPKDLSNRWQPQAISRGRMKLGQLLREARLRMGLSFREAAAKSRQVAERLGDGRYFAAASSLSDYETADAPPRHIHKIISLCISYGVPFQSFLRTEGLASELGGKNPIPDSLAQRIPPPEGLNLTDLPLRDENPQFDLLLDGAEIPIRLRSAIGTLAGQATLVANDFFWLGSTARSASPHLSNGLLAVVNRHKKKPLYSREKAMWQQPLSVIFNRNGTYSCACCSFDGGSLVIHPCSGSFEPPKKLSVPQEAEVIGQITMVARTLSST